jgi:DNA-binding NtrC family response regulator
MPDANRHRVLVVSGNTEVSNELVTLLSGYGYFVESSRNRIEGVRKFRAHKQPIVILDLPILRIMPARLINLIHRIRRNTIVLIAANKKEEAEAFDKLGHGGVYDILDLPLKTDSLKSTLNRALEHHRLTLENIFVKNVLFFGLLMSPIWLLAAYFLVR